MAKARVAIIGAGSVGQAVGFLLRRKHYSISAIACRTRASAEAAAAFVGGKTRIAAKPASAARGADILFLTTPDRMIQPVCEAMVAGGTPKRGAMLFHCSGAHGAEVLAAARSRKVHVAALHPIQSFASPEQAVKRIKGACFTFDGDDEARPAAEEIVAALGSKLMRSTPHDRAMYHAGLCVLSNYLVAIADLGHHLLGLSGMEEKEADQAARPLLKGTVENIAAMGATPALTGPIARGDVETVAEHLRAMARLPDPIRKLYCSIGLYTVRVGRRKGTLKAPEARQLITLLTRRPGA